MNGTRIVSVLLAVTTVACPAVAHGESAAIERLPREEVRRRVQALPALLAQDIAALQYLLGPEELAELLSHPETERCARWVEAWWRSRDPVYTTGANEARAEHERRVAVARSRFSSGAWPGWDDRGEVFIRYGEPAGRSRESADAAAPGIYVAPKEYWYYPRFDMFVPFVDAYASGHYTLYLEDVDLPPGERPRNDRRVIASELNPDYDVAYTSFDIEFPGALRLPEPFAGKGYDDFMERIYRYHEVVESFPAAYPFDFAEHRIPMFFAVQSFRGDRGADRVYVSAEFESSVTPLTGEANVRRFTTTSVFWDLEGKEIARHERVDSVHTVPFVKDSLVTVINQARLTLPPATYQMAITVREEDSGRFTSLQRVVGCDPMEGGLAMSDLTLARRIGRARASSAFNRGPLEVVPRPSARYRLGVPVPVYFEVYHIARDAGGAHPYTVEYAIKPMQPRPPGFWKRLFRGAGSTVAVRSRFDAAAGGPDDVVHVAANTENLWPGEFVLEVTITDGAASRRVSRETTFHVLP